MPQWLIHNPRKFVVTWTGRPGPDALKVRYFGEPRIRHATSHFGSGVLTFAINYLSRTPPGYNLYVRGPANLPKDGITALEGIVETDWSEATFTMNWVVTRRKHPIVFEEGEPIGMISPIRRGELERFRPEIHAIDDNAQLRAGYEAWMRSRAEFIAATKGPDSDAHRRGQLLHARHYRDRARSARTPDRARARTLCRQTEVRMIRSAALSPSEASTQSPMAP